METETKEHHMIKLIVHFHKLTTFCVGKHLSLTQLYTDSPEGQEHRAPLISEGTIMEGLGKPATVWAVGVANHLPKPFHETFSHTHSIISSISATYLTLST